jgi:hypothetical protein
MVCRQQLIAESSPHAGAEFFEARRDLTMNSVTHPLTKAVYGQAIDAFWNWCTVTQRGPISKDLIQQYKSMLVNRDVFRKNGESGSVAVRNLSSSTVNKNLAAVRKSSTKLRATDGLMLALPRPFERSSAKGSEWGIRSPEIERKFSSISRIPKP